MFMSLAYSIKVVIYPWMQLSFIHVILYPAVDSDDIEDLDVMHDPNSKNGIPNGIHHTGLTLDSRHNEKDLSKLNNKESRQCNIAPVVNYSFS